LPPILPVTSLSDILAGPWFKKISTTGNQNDLQSLASKLSSTLNIKTVQQLCDSMSSSAALLDVQIFNDQVK